MLTVREVAEKDIIPLAEFFPTEPPFRSTTKETWLRRFNTWWTANPAYTDQFPRGWILENDTSIVGFIGNIPVKFRIGREVKTAVASVTWYVVPSVRGLFSIRLFTEFLKQKNVSLFLYNTDNKDIIPILSRYKFKEYTLPRFQTKYYLMLQRSNMDFIVRKFLINEDSEEDLTSLTELLAVFKRFGLLMCAYLFQKPVIRRDVLPDKDYTTSLCTFCDDTFSRIWEPFLQACDVTLSRDTQTLNWIYFSSIEPNKRVVIQCRRSRDNSLAGYMVFDIFRKTTSDVGKMQLMDLCLGDKDPRVMASLLSYAIEIGKQHNAALLVLWADSQETESYLRNTFLLRSGFQHHNYIRLSDGLKENSESLIVCPSFIAPPRGVDHFP
jgi:hypothetical protein